MKVRPKDKPDYLDLPAAYLDSTLLALEYGDTKHGVGTWRKSDDPHVHIAAAIRHLFATANNADARDDDSGLMHLAHAAANLAIAINTVTRQRGTTYAEEKAKANHHANLKAKGRPN